MGQQLQAKVAEIQEKLDAQEIPASAGGGMVTAVVDGKGTVKSQKIDQAVVDPEDVEMLEDLVLAAVEGALDSARETMSTEMAKVTSGMGLPAGMDMPF